MNRRESGVLWSRTLPAQWDETRAKFLFRRMRLPPPTDTGVVTAFRDGLVTLRENRRSDGFTFATKEIGYQGVQAGQLVISSMDGFAGAIGVSDSNGKCTPVYLICHPIGGSSPRYYAYVLRHMALTGFITSLARGIRERSTSFGWSDFSEQLLPAPRPDTQRAIADFLDRKTAAIDALIEKKERLIALLAEKRAALIHRAVTKGLDPEVPMKDSGVPWIGEIPAHWRVRRFKYVADLETGHTPSKSTPEYWVPEDCVNLWISLNDTKTLDDGDFISDTRIKISDIGMKNSAAHLIESGAIVFNRDGARVGLASITTAPMAVSQHLIAWVCGPFVLNRFGLYVIYAMRDEIYRLCTGATIPTIGMGDIKGMTTTVPPLAEQRAIVSWLVSNTERNAKATSLVALQLDKLREYRQSLITAAVTGQLDIGEDAA